MSAKIGIVGLWHLGCSLSACWAELGHDVIGVDGKSSVIEGLKKGEAPIYEPGLNDVLKKHLQSGRLAFGADLKAVADCDFVFLTYDTPVLEGDESDLGILDLAIQALGGAMKDGAIVVVSSQTPAGTCLKFRKALQAKNSKLELVYSPENLRLGEAMQSYLKPGRIILGAESPAARDGATRLFQEIGAEIIPMGLTSSEMVKHGINSFLSLSITYANQLADLCEASGADVLDVIRGVKTDPRIGQKAYLAPGIGFSGGTLGRDLKVLQHLNEGSRSGADLFASIYAWNSERKNRIVEKAKKISGSSLTGKKVGVLGLTYKPGTSTLRRSLPVEIVELLLRGGAKVSVFDPKADYGEWKSAARARQAASAQEILADSETVLLLTEWPEFRAIPWKECCNREKPQAVLDAKNFLSDLELGKMGYRYFGMGR